MAVLAQPSKRSSHGNHCKSAQGSVGSMQDKVWHQDILQADPRSQLTQKERGPSRLAIIIWMRGHDNDPLGMWDSHIHISIGNICDHTGVPIALPPHELRAHEYLHLRPAYFSTETNQCATSSALLRSKPSHLACLLASRILCDGALQLAEDTLVHCMSRPLDFTELLRSKMLCCPF